MVAKVKEVDADAIGMSGLLVKSTLIMRDNLEELNDLGLAELPVLLGGAALTRTLRRARPARGLRGPAVLRPRRVRGPLDARQADGHEAQRRVGPRLRPVPTGRELPERVRARRARPPSTLPRRSPDVVTDNEVFVPPFLGSRVVKGIALDDIAEYVNETALFRNQWQFRPEKEPAGSPRATTSSRPASARRSASSSPRPRRPACSCRRSCTATSRPTATATTSSCGPTRPARPRRARFHYPRQKVEPYLCIADFFRPVESGEVDYAAFHIVTMGARRQRGHRRAVRRRTTTRSTCCCTASASRWPRRWPSYWHRRIREEWGFVGEDGPTVGGLFRQQYRGGRYSWGYPACPDLEDNATVGRAARRRSPRHRGVSEETGWQYQPEQTTSAIICHHPQAKYFVAR